MKEIIVGIHVILIDDEDYERVLKYSWRIKVVKVKGGGRVVKYAQAHSPMLNGKRVTIRMHRLILNAPTGVQVDHIDGNGLNNQKSNLRFATSSENMQNSKAKAGAASKFKGVCWNKNESKWVVRIFVDGKRMCLGQYTDEAQAAKVYDKAAREFFGEFACLNFND
jgi:hypothetical protein